MLVEINPSKIYGKVKAPQSKSFGIRLVLYSLLKESKLDNLIPSDDVNVAINVVKQLGVSVEGTYFKREKELVTPKFLYFGGSATTLRMSIPILSVLGVDTIIDGDETLRKRPLNAIIKALEGSVSFSSSLLPTKISGKLKENFVRIEGGESSQYISGFIYAFSLVGGGEIEIIPPISSKSYIYLTIELLNSLGGNIKMKGNKIYVEKGDFKPYIGKVPGDYALASFYASSSIVSGGEIVIEDVYELPNFDGDHSIVNFYKMMGAESYVKDNKWIVKSSEKLNGIEVNVDDYPDLAPSIASLAPFSSSPTIIKGIKRLKTKESNRVVTISETLSKFGVKVEYDEDKIVIYPSEVKAGHVICPNDHRIAMLASVLSFKSGGTIEKAECVNKSNPNFWKDLISLNGRIIIR
ncbi:3-phosphoshikimate 1-carboxyvinyltransferase [Sulfurisphaera tokodaii]|uniref:3-phosphoshikimate 1-carboxyvinyltransferase n=2 Tax=Sulfurisphaera tokodaii TaxID=111955 RepID=AROA_SULTO|nr:3-phosphoshikimate 1-carboxyvinyltransferase [Sulfurisphaera tokodaii]Q96Y91.1 RecName: Full=3-phosphoshikimate 1-carboxyvinyltransferase; AltName: Full=5-enolpyruvylshikimate-3-phosphate synthase; Short=EPSP synthase; Short=EPSPS [Sulfurisphaera tokodaii str. 7]BAK54775.1 3-phosphoshikimate 1-carboxyvinyltransferase [Sulfurisphaera tokodaii str. 7]HII75097.1 3-phosphoshikimate 1-carboxyvinyltransferase [Sulfurisphaera tokodaii]